MIAAALTGAGTERLRWTGCLPVHGGRTVCEAAAASAAGFALVLILVYLAVFVISMIAAVKVVTKAGYSGWWVLITLIPLVGFVMALVFAFADWPVLRELRTLRSQRATAWPYAAAQGYGGGGGWEAEPVRRSEPSAPWSAPGTGPAAGSGPDATDVEAPGQAAGAPGEQPLPPFRQSGPSADPKGATSGGWAGSTPDAAPPGWYPTPDGRRRYWDGHAWTDHFA